MTPLAMSKGWTEIMPPGIDAAAVGLTLSPLTMIAKRPSGEKAIDLGLNGSYLFSRKHVRSPDAVRMTATNPGLPISVTARWRPSGVNVTPWNAPAAEPRQIRCIAPGTRDSRLMG